MIAISYKPRANICGIAGIFNLNGEPVSPVLLRKMTDAIAHRGPDGEGFYVGQIVIYDNFVKRIYENEFTYFFRG